MSFNGRIIKLEGRIKANKVDESPYDDWTDEELESYAKTGIKPTGREIKLTPASEGKYANWSNEELETYADTGIKPKRFA